MKKCRKCGIVKSSDEYYNRKNTCKACSIERAKKRSKKLYQEKKKAAAKRMQICHRCGEKLPKKCYESDRHLICIKCKKAEKDAKKNRRKKEMERQESRDRAAMRKSMMPEKSIVERYIERHRIKGDLDRCMELAAGIGI